MKYIFINLLFLLSISIVASDIEKKHLFVVSGVVVNSDSGQKVENFVKMIEKKSGYKLKAFYVDSYTRLSEVLRKNPDALAWTCGAPYVQDHIRDAQQLIVVPLFNGVPTYSSYIVSRKSDKGTKLSDFKSRVFVYSDPRSNSGFVAPAKLLKDSGYDINNFFRLKIHAGIHEKSIEAIYRGVADVGAIDEYVWVEYIRTRPQLSEKLHVIQKIGPFPFTPIVAGKNVDKGTLLKLQKALVNMNKEELDRFKKDFLMDGFVVKNNSFYQVIKNNMIYTGIDLEK